MGNEGSQSETTAPAAAVENDLRVGWRRVGAGDGTIGARDGHCAAAVAGGKVFVFGGVVENSALGPSESNDLFIFCPETESWNVVEATGDIPPPRSSAAMAAVGCNLFLFGGLSQSTGWMNSVFMFDTERSTWKELNASGSCPSPRDKLTATAIGCRIYIFGGFGPVSASQEANDSDEEDDDDDEGSEEDASDAGDLDGAQKAAKFGWFDDLFAFDTVTLSWSHPMQLNKSGPTRRAAHTTCAVSNKLVVFGGRDPIARKNDLHVFNTESRKWITDLPLTGIPPSPRSFHAACVVGHRIVIFGGRGVDNEHFNDIHVLDTETWQWMKPSVVDGEPPTPRGLSTATVVGDQVLVFGGSSDFAPDTMQCLTYFAETYVLKVDDLLRETPVTGVSGVGPEDPVQQRTGEGDVLRTTSDQSAAVS